MGHFIGGHPALDLVNTVYDRHDPPVDNELLKTGQELAAWLRSQKLVRDEQAADVASLDPEPLRTVWLVRDAAFNVFDAVAGGRSPDSKAVGGLLSTAGVGFASRALAWEAMPARVALAPDFGAHDVPALLAALALDALYRLPPARLRACPRCGWLFTDTSKGNQRRWCSMNLCGNREKVARHRQRA
ncbi:CGNR zinc finger domain-containing protein [Sphingosinicella sp. LHD-64]|uniref:CGNR zinc finger domain-containing protein n=1 Tax=Sphingosinicella sp. LHD-64 TaxID=3072139 RepID=UPI00280DC469|nr:CGNR zinc finger domain-containing protein [Sphingosinicella sp. LHD-64]MDQ8754616.1 CGNR zinc finger domain-containing protein [Sphingosinicella sp. LHD-64]